jgi:hypothetical protein
MEKEESSSQQQGEKKLYNPYEGGTLLDWAKKQREREIQITNLLSKNGLPVEEAIARVKSSNDAYHAVREHYEKKK